MYFPYFIAYIVIGLGITLLVFWWAVKSGQFQDQQRARFLPLRDQDNSPVKVSRFSRWEMYGLFFLACAGLAATAALLLFAAYARPG